LEDLRDRESINEGLEVASEVREAVQYLHSEGLVHGDLANNILYDGETFKMFDPVGTPKDRDGYHRMKELDEHDYESLERGAKMPFEQFF
jgi:tRNA A-37 threonylcarbamoyl transferase component Bud32